MAVTTGGGFLFFKPVYFFPKRTQTFGLFWPLSPILAIFSLYALFGVPFTLCVGLPNLQISGLVYDGPCEDS